MQPIRFAVALLAGFVALAGLGVSSRRVDHTAAQSTAASAADWSPGDAAGYLDGRAVWWLGWSGSARGSGTACVSCHTSGPIALALPELPPGADSAAALVARRSLIDDVRTRVVHWNNIVSRQSASATACALYYGDKPRTSLGTESVLNALVLTNYDRVLHGGRLDPGTQAALTYLWQQQQPDGSWRWLDFGLRPWESDGTYYGTALAAIAVGMAGRPYYERPDLQPNISSMRRYLQAGLGARPLHDQIVCLWAASWLPGLLSHAQKIELIRTIDTAQNPDGGWSLAQLGKQTGAAGSAWQEQAAYPAGSESDGYACGLAVLALERSGVPPSNPELHAGIAWLDSNERAGSWPASYINGGRDPHSDIGKFMRDASTSFAVLALTDRQAGAGRPPVRTPH